MKGHRVRLPIGRSPTLLVLACAALPFIGGGVERTAAQSYNIDEAVSAHGVLPKLQLDASTAKRDLSGSSQRQKQGGAEPVCHRSRAEVPPMIELYTLPDDILANNPDTKLYKFTRVDDQIVLVDPVKLRAIAVISVRRPGLRLHDARWSNQWATRAPELGQRSRNSRSRKQTSNSPPFHCRRLA